MKKLIKLKYFTFLLVSYLATPSCSYALENKKMEFTTLSGSIIGTATNAIEATTCTDGSISLDISNANGPFFIQWSNGEITENIDGLSPGEYCVTVTDNLCGEARGCWEVGCCPFLLEDEQIQFNISNPACEGQGELELIISDVPSDEFPLTIYLDNLLGEKKYDLEINSATSNFNELSEGNYSAQIIYGDGCTYNFEFNIEFQQIEIQYDKTPSCDNDGTIQVNAFEGKTPYTYAWSDNPNETGSYRSGLGPNLYTVTVTDANGCSNAASGYIKQSDPILIEDMPVEIIPSDCNTNTGQITIVSAPEGGNPPFSYEWSNGISGTVISQLSGGTYELTITDIEGCEINSEYIVGINGMPIIFLGKTLNTCAGGNTGGVGITAYSTTGAELEYEWSNGSTTEDLSGLSAGLYTVSITDQSNMCTLVKTYTVIEFSPDPIIATTTSEPNCPGLNTDNGSISLSVSGGINPISYIWSNGATTQNNLNLSKGDYFVTISGKCGTTGVFSEYVDAIEILGNSSYELNFGEITIMTNPDGGESPYTYLWENGATSQSTTVLEQGAYKVTITDASGCPAIETIDINYYCEPLAIRLAATQPNGDCNSSVNLGIHKIIGNNSIEGTAPFLLKIEESIDQEWTIIANLILNTKEALDQYVYSSSTTGTYRITVIDNCGDTFEKIYEGCFNCDYEFYTGGGDNDEVYVSIFDKMLIMEQVCPCTDDCDWGLTHDKIKLTLNHAALNTFKNSILGSQSFKIVWPTGPNSTINYNINQGKFVITGPSKYVLSEDEFESGISVSVSMNLPNGIGEICNLTIPFIFGQKGYNGRFIIHEFEEGYFNPFPAYGRVFNIGTVACSTKCVIPLITGKLYDNEPNNYDESGIDDLECVSDLDESVILFRYEPINYDDPCTGGGILETHIETDNGIVRSLIYIPYGTALDGYPVSFPLLSDNFPYSQYTCLPYESNKGYCLFDAMDVYGVSLNHKLLVEYCESFEYDPPIDSDGDGLVDDIDPCPYDPDVFCDDDDDGNTNTGNDIDENGCVTTFHRDECKLSIVCPDENIQFIEGSIEEETHSGIDPCVYCFTADICRVVNPNTGEEYISPVGSPLNAIGVNLVDDPDCPNYCAHQYICLITGQTMGTICAGPQCNLSDAWDNGCGPMGYEDILTFQTNDDGSMTFQSILSNEQVMTIIKRESSKNQTSKLEMYTIPNPSATQFRIKIYSPNKHENKVSIKNILGELVYSKKMVLDFGENELSIDNNFVNGVYYISIRNANGNHITIKHIINE